LRKIYGCKYICLLGDIRPDKYRNINIKISLIVIKTPIIVFIHEGSNAVLTIYNFCNSSVRY